MSKQLALSSTFATIAMATMALAYTPDRSEPSSGDSLVAVEAELPQGELPGPSLLPG